MSIKDWLVLDEVQSATSAGTNLVSVASRTSHFWLKQFLGFIVPFATGTAASLLIVDAIIKPSQAQSLKEVIVGILTFVSVLAGFMVTLMLFTGRTDSAKLLSARQAPAYVDKMTYLLFSQASALAVHITCAAVCLIWMLLYGVGAKGDAISWLFHASFGLLAVAMVKSLLLPLQIYELHRFEFDALLDQKRIDVEASKQSELAKGGVDLIPRN
ncbi:hypothetical protein Q6A26_03310 [Xanthomonas euvesicatoria pv. eucalypti]|uniref:hypothetical protein n=2 Tax=Xanthomonas TaxID=338 RepID=UPI0026E1AB5A|nr:hypothetical protein [Xanthomonas euvesicatoria]MDO7930607.1 hypothetical protein [Xanthomonas euvesicatoria pv. eucalypti]MDO7934845.1 hypothetical protein [Xanthomonas euvesicatoria pv. eucalypti]MDO7938988.1 hypothetical protein [Xanthomonas euvesicatoria pv. eucalypti]MDO7943194.1 hypothetical protein [Xanthomonas euvesicatoria pv. eucalypti]MDO7947304.1 hypothetical protein [Xanthomonas euvesicatoria pv. eucalypti]